MGKIQSKKIEYNGHVFDSKTEYEFYRYLLTQENVSEIILQPNFTLLESFFIACGRCEGTGKVPSPKTGRPIKCKTCKGTGRRKRQAWTYTADFEVIYKDGYREVFDVKGHANERFPYVRKMWEKKFGKELIVVKKKKGEWVRV